MENAYTEPTPRHFALELTDQDGYRATTEIDFDRRNYRPMAEWVYRSLNNGESKAMVLVISEGGKRLCEVGDLEAQFVECPICCSTSPKSYGHEYAKCGECGHVGHADLFPTGGSSEAEIVVWLHYAIEELRGELAGTPEFMACYECGGFDGITAPQRLVIALGPVVGSDPTETYRLECGHTTI